MDKIQKLREAVACYAEQRFASEKEVDELFSYIREIEQSKLLNNHCQSCGSTNTTITGIFCMDCQEYTDY